MRRVDGDALGTVRGDGVPEVEVFRDVLRREDGASPAARSEALDHDGAVAPDVGDPPAVAVLHPPAAHRPDACGRSGA